MTTNEWLRGTRNVLILPNGMEYPGIRPCMKCADGFSISVQASEFHYCKPRVNKADNYESVELGLPNAVEPLIMEYAENPDDPTKTVYGWVPVEIVDKVIEKHGGIINFNEGES